MFVCVCVWEGERERFILNLITPETFEETSNNENDCEGNDWGLEFLFVFVCLQGQFRQTLLHMKK